MRKKKTPKPALYCLHLWHLPKTLPWNPSPSDEKPVSLYSLVHSPAYEAIIVHKIPSIPSLPVQRYPPVFFPSVHLVHFSW